VLPAIVIITLLPHAPTPFAGMLCHCHGRIALLLLLLLLLLLSRAHSCRGHVAFGLWSRRSQGRITLHRHHCHIVHCPTVVIIAASCTIVVAASLTTLVSHGEL
jgi:hypothetical protein